MNDRRIVLATVLALALAACGEKTADGGNALGTDSLVIRGQLAQWRIEMPRTRLESIVAALRVTGLPLLNLTRSAPEGRPSPRG